jgi:hypothetical protein
VTESLRLSSAFRVLLIAGCLLPSARASILTPEWSRPLTSPVISAAARPTEDGTEELFLLLADRRVMVVSLLDSLVELGRAPEGTAALVALPCVGAGAGVPVGTAREANAVLLLAVRTRGASGSCNMIAWNRRGQPLWEAPAPGLRGIDSLTFIAWYEDRAELCAWQQGEPWLVLVGHEQVRATRLNPGFLPLDALIVDLDQDRIPELVFFDGRQLAIYHPRQNRELRCQWPDLPSTVRQEPEIRGPKPLLACAVFDSIPVLLVLTGDTLRYIDALTGAEKRRLALDSSSGLPGIPRAVCASGSAAYVAGADRQGRGYIAALAPSGPARPPRFLPLPNRARIYALVLLRDWPMPLVSTGYGPEHFLIYAPGLAGAADNSPGYSGARLIRVLPLRIDGDTFPDLVVVRTAADARWRIDVFSNRLGLLTRELEQARQILQHAALGRNENEVFRAIRRVDALVSEIGPGATSSEAQLLHRYRLAVRRRTIITYVGALGVFCLAVGLGVLAVIVTRGRARPAGQQIEDKPLPIRITLAAELVAVDHNFISKGNTPAAIERLIEIRNRHGLMRDRDLGRLARAPDDRGTSLRDIYTSAISRLIDATPTLPVLDFIETTARSAPRGRHMETLELSQEEYRGRARSPGTRLIAIVNRECPDCYRRLRLFADPEFRGTLEHIILDHIRHAGTWADITLCYTVNTQWNRRLLIRLLSDSPHVIPLRDPRAHITSQLLELAARLGPAIETPRDDIPLTGPHEKLWLRITDYIAALEETRDRLLTP